MIFASLMMPSINKALIIRLSSVGDILLSTPLIRVFRKRFPECQVDFLVKSEYDELVRHNPHISAVIGFQGSAGGSLGAIRRKIRATGYDLVVDIHDNIRSRYLSFGHPRVVRVDKRIFPRLVLVSTGLDLYGEDVPGVADRYIETVASLGIENDGKGLEIHIPEGIVKAVRDRIGDTGPFVGVAPGARHGTKMWPAPSFAEAAHRVARETGRGVLLFGSASETDCCLAVETILRKLDPEMTVTNLAGRTTLSEAAAFMDHCTVVIANDSGLMHLATARKCKVIALFGPTVRQFGFFPGGTGSLVIEHDSLSCRPCTTKGTERCPKGHFRCMTDLLPGRVAGEALSLLKN